MTWQDDLAAAQARQHEDVIAEASAIAEAARARTPWLARLRAADGATVALVLADGLRVEGVVAAVADEVIEVADGAVTWLVRPVAVALVPGLPGVLPAAGDDGQRPRVRLTWGMALRPWTGTSVTVHLCSAVAGQGADAQRGALAGELVGVGADHLDVRLADAALGMAAGVVATIPTVAVAAVRCG